MDAIKKSYRRTLEWGYFIALSGSILLLHTIPHYESKSQKTHVVQLNISVQDIPLTQQGTFKPPPLKPAVPIPVENESIPLDETINVTELNFDNSPISDNGFVGASQQFIAPQAFAGAVAEYPPDDYKNKVTGEVKLNALIDKRGRVKEIIVLENTTGSNACAKAAIEAANKSRYYPARRGKEIVEAWVTMRITFEIPD
ncbi:TonB family protein [candidate division KSB1 bacterium]|nr:TonB family protein [candidate division KSB1 bacterium]